MKAQLKEGFEQLSKIAEKRRNKEEKCPHCGKLGGRAYFLDGRVRCWECDKISNYKEWFK